MHDYSVFDIIGPVMVGPSSSHTAGAARMGLLAGKLCKEKIVKVVFTLYGSFARTAEGHGTKKAILGGVLGFSPDDTRIRESFDHAKEQGVEFEFLQDFNNNDVHPNTADMELTDVNGKVLHVRGKSVGGGKVVIENINGVQVDFTGSYPTILVEQIDAPGVVAFITSALSLRKINIAFMRLYREAKGHKAYTIIEADESIPKEVIADIEAHKDILSATLLEVD